MTEKIATQKEFYRWAKIRMLDMGVNQRQIADQLGTVPPRISDVLRGSIYGRKYIVPFIRALDGDPQMFDLEALTSKYKEKGA